MKKKLFIAGLTAALAFPAVVLAKEVTLTTELTNYRGDGAYIAIYLTDSDGAYQGTLWVAGGKSKYYKHLGGWARGSGLDPAEYDGLTGASVTSGRTLKVTLNLDDSLIDNGYEVRVDSAVEDMRDIRADVIAPLTTEGSGKPVSGRGYVRALTYELQ